MACSAAASWAAACTADNRHGSSAASAADKFCATLRRSTARPNRLLSAVNFVSSCAKLARSAVSAAASSAISVSANSKICSNGINPAFASSNRGASR